MGFGFGVGGGNGTPSAVITPAGFGFGVGGGSGTPSATKTPLFTAERAEEELTDAEPESRIRVAENAKEIVSNCFS